MYSKKKTEGYANMYKMKLETSKIDSISVNTTINKGIDVDKIKGWDEIELPYKTDHIDDYSINTSNFTNRFDIGNNVDKIELSNIYVQNDKKININSVDNLAIQLIKHDAFDIIDEKEENHVSDITQDGMIRNNLKDSLEDSGFNVKNYFGSWNEWSRDFDLAIDI